MTTGGHWGLPATVCSLFPAGWQYMLWNWRAPYSLKELGKNEWIQWPWPFVFFFLLHPAVYRTTSPEPHCALNVCVFKADANRPSQDPYNLMAFLASKFDIFMVLFSLRHDVLFSENVIATIQILSSCRGSDLDLDAFRFLYGWGHRWWSST